MLAQAINSTKPTAPNRIQSVCFTVVPTNTSINVRRRMPFCAFESGYCLFRFAAMLFMSACACACVTPGLSRPTPYKPG